MKSFNIVKSLTVLLLVSFTIVAVAEPNEVEWMRSIERDLMTIRDDVDRRNNSAVNSAIQYESLINDLDTIVEGVNAGINRRYQTPREINAPLRGVY